MHYLCLVLMGFISFEDIRYQQINVIYLLLLLVTSYLHGSINVERLFFSITFFIMWLLHYCGLADIFVILSISLHLNQIELASSLIICCILAMLHFGIIKRNRTIPFTPYLIAGYLIVSIFQMLH